MIQVYIIIYIPDDGLSELRAIYAEERERLRQELEQARRGQICITCPCGWSGWYATPGRAKMGLSAHQMRRKCRDI
jgi:hypothetical protein